MTTRFAGSSEFSGSATICRFPPRGRFALRERGYVPDSDRSLPLGARQSCGSGWYHDEAIAAEQPGRKN